MIFFCSCEFPVGCHRHGVATLVKAAATRRGIDVNVIEWPGGEPSAIEVSESVLRAIRGGKTTLALPDAMEAGAGASLPWGTSAVLRAGTDELAVLLGPAHFAARGSHLKIFGVDSAIRESGGYERVVGEFRRSRERRSYVRPPALSPPSSSRTKRPYYLNTPATFGVLSSVCPMRY